METNTVRRHDSRQEGRGVCLDIKTPLFIFSVELSWHHKQLPPRHTAASAITKRHHLPRVQRGNQTTGISQQTVRCRQNGKRAANNPLNKKCKIWAGEHVTCHSGLIVICQSTSSSLFLIHLKDFWMRSLLWFPNKDERGLLFSEMLTQEDARSPFFIVTGLTHRHKSIGTTPPVGWLALLHTVTHMFPAAFLG